MKPPSPRMFTVAISLPVGAMSSARSSAVMPSSLKWSMMTTAPTFGFMAVPAKKRRVTRKSGATWQRPLACTIGHGALDGIGDALADAVGIDRARQNQYMITNPDIAVRADGNP